MLHSRILKSHWLTVSVLPSFHTFSSPDSTHVIKELEKEEESEPQTNKTASNSSASAETSITWYWQPPVSDSKSCESALWRIPTLSGRREDPLICAESFHSAVHTAH